MSYLRTNDRQLLYNLAMRLGIIQGRLSPPVRGQIQAFPIDTWRQEFILLKELNLNHIEWIQTEVTDPWPDRHDSISSICCDYLMDPRFRLMSKDGLIWTEIGLHTAARHATDVGIERLTIPLLEDSSVADPVIREVFMKAVSKTLREWPTVHLSFETDLSDPRIASALTGPVWDSRLSLTYDTGNMTSAGVDHVPYLFHVIDRVGNVHLKDRTKDGQTLPPGEGETNFDDIFATLYELGYNGLVTMQFARGKDREEFETIRNYRDWVLAKWEQQCTNTTSRVKQLSSLVRSAYLAPSGFWHYSNPAHRSF